MSNKANTRTTPNTRAVKNARTATKTSSLTIWVVAGGLVLAVVAVVVASLVTKADPVEGQVQNVAVEGAALPAHTDQGDDPAVGAEAPVLEGRTFAGESLTIGGAAGSPSIVVFVAHWCPHCQAEVPRLVDWRADGTVPDDIDLFAVATGTDEAQPNYPPQDWLEGEDWPGEVLVDNADGSAASAYGLSSYPFFVALNADGTVAARGAGELDQAGIEALVATLEAPQ